MKTGHKILIILGILLLIFVFAKIITIKSSRQQVSYPEGIGSSQELVIPQPSTSDESAVATKSSSSESSSKASSRVVIKSGELNIVVSDVEGNVKKIIDYTERNNGWVVSSNVIKINETPSGTVTIRVPVEKFENAMNYFSSLAVKVENEKREGQDVTEEYVDLKSQLCNLETAEKQLLVVMKKANTISEVLAVQREIKTVRGEIEKTKGKILYIQRSAKMSTITVNFALSEELLPVPSGERWKPQYVAKQAWKNVVAFWRSFVYLLIRVGIYALIWLPIVIIFWLIWKRKRKRQNQKRKK